MALPEAFHHFNGLYSEVGPFVFMDSMRILAVCGIFIVIVLVVIVSMLVRFVRRRRASSRQQIARRDSLESNSA